MFAREFGYTEEYIDWNLDMDRIFAHIEYIHENPPAGTILKKIVEAFAGENGQSQTKPKFKSRKEKEEYDIKQFTNDLGFDVANLPRMPKRKVGNIADLMGEGGKN